MSQNKQLFRLQVLAGTHTQDELFLLSDQQLLSFVKENRINLPNDHDEKYKLSRKDVCSHIRAQGKGIEKTYYRGEEFWSEVDLARRWPGKIGKISVDNTPPDCKMKPGETLKAFAQRLAAFVASQPDASDMPPNSFMHDQVIEDNIQNGEGQDDSPPVKKHNLPPLDISVNLDGMTVKQLREYAAEREIDLEGTTSKNDIIRRLQYRMDEAVTSMHG